MAIVLGTITAAALDAAGTTLSVTAHNHAGGTNSLLLAFLVFRSNVNALAHTVSATWNGVGLTQALAVPAAAGVAFNDQLCWVGYIRGAATGAQTFAVTFNRSVNGAAAFLVNLTGVDQSATIGATVQTEESVNSATTTSTMTTLGADSLVFLACGITKITTQPTFNSGWTHRVTRQYGANVGLSIQPTPASLATQVKATAGSITGTATWPDSGTQRNVSLVEIRAATAEPPPPIGELDHGVFGVGPITGADAGMGLVLRRDETGDMGAAVDVYSAEAAFADRRHRIESAPGEAVSGKDRGIDLVLSAGTGVAMYLNGAATAHSYRSATAPTGATDINAGTLWVGASSRDSAIGGWSGLLDELRFHPSAFGPERIADERANQSDGRLIYGLGDDDAYGGTASPVAVPATATVEAGKTVDIDVLSRAVNPSGGALSISSVGQPNSGSTATVGGLLRYQSVAGFLGNAVGTYGISGGGKTSSSRYIVFVTEPSEPPPPPPTEDLPVPTRSINATPTTLRGILAGTSSSGALRPGDHIFLADGTYSGGEYQATANGNSTSPIVVRAVNRGQATFRSAFSLRGTDVWIWGLTFLNVTAAAAGMSTDYIGAVSCNAARPRIIRCHFRNTVFGYQNSTLGESDMMGFMSSSSGGKVLRCMFEYDIATSPPRPTTARQYEAKGINVALNLDFTANDGLEIAYCHFRNFPGDDYWGGSNVTYGYLAGGVLDVGGLINGNVRARCTVDFHHNIVENCGANSDITYRSNGGKVRFCTFLGGRSYLRYRTAQQLVTEGCTFDGCRGLGLLGYRHIARGNRFSNGAAMHLPTGNTTVPAMIASGVFTEKRAAAQECRLYGNIGSTVIGYPSGSGYESQPALDNFVYRHADLDGTIRSTWGGSLTRVSGNEVRTTISAALPSGETLVTPLRLSSADVGPSS